ncbi:glycoside hydrolase family 1 protein [Nocardia tengchongensis]|uniref:Glycoside hydrolase family 1 protein n=1 Tax=Nocardia tengchongensis TaxID=2055889 RepID=A0ABX8CHJ8_9NOCA|nr:family 1 glycosylhydrolase [Nocardia tengchongensis]QVI18766.1 glycoside hydrolase family 1 protein [Nocardia tengchongensis]
MGHRVLFSLVSVVLAAWCAVVIPGKAVADPGLPPVGGKFLWGVSSSGFQSEGFAPDSNWSRYAGSGRAESYLNSVDFLHRYGEDIQNAADLGVGVYRVSVEWARVQLNPGEWDFSFYDNMIARIRAAGMRPMITLDHWVFPGWALDRGGWRNPGMVEDWLTNARAVVDRYAGADPLWVTFNEPLAYVGKEQEIGDIGAGDVVPMIDRMVAAHRAIYDHIHARQGGALVTSNIAFTDVGADQADTSFIDRIADKVDYIGIDYYYGGSLNNPPNVLAQLTNQPSPLILEPDGIYYALRRYAHRFPGRPLYIVENGMPTYGGSATTDGMTRADNLRDTVYWVQRAKADGMNVIGYNYWSITDNYEWGSYAPRFGLYTVDVTTDSSLSRRPTPAVPAYRDIALSGGVPAGYLPTRAPALCSIQDLPSSCLFPVTAPGR